MRLTAIVVLTMLFGSMNFSMAGAADEAPPGWTANAPREEIKPSFSYDAKGGPTGQGCFVIDAADRPAPQGCWTKTFTVEGGQHYKFFALRKTNDALAARRSCVVEISWQDEQGKLVRSQERDDLARSVFPRDRGLKKNGWNEVSQTYTAPPKATRAVVKLHLRWTPGVRVRWADVVFGKTESPPGRKVRLASVHFRPRNGKTAQGNRELFAPLIAQAAEKGADLVCLPESLTLFGNGLKYADAAEAVPGPSTEYFGKLAKKHDLYIVAGIMERAGPIVYNVAVLLGPDGGLVGKYRKTCIPREEIKGGVAPGKDYPVFETRFGKVGMMICWDVHFPEVARNLSNHGAEVIAMPIWGGHPALAKARALENQIFLVTSTYTDPTSRPKWMISGVWDTEGQVVAEASQWGTVVVAEVDLDQLKPWQFIGDFRGRIPRERPLSGFVE